MKVIVDEKSISINAIFGILIQSKENRQKLDSFTSNNYNIPNIEANLVTA